MNNSSHFTLAKGSSQQPLPLDTPLFIAIEKPAIRTPLAEAVKKDFWPPKIKPADSNTPINKKPL